VLLLFAGVQMRKATIERNRRAQGITHKAARLPT
jgi:hypothetical protein